ncbi:malto-oligosyltrehalose synthase [uncultured Mycolicibacterium sp.]|uniref:malto-oligosyltrehalose synthase n=1 Tax=uncultured Mycolicibacterium sp. TaxID=2320817 RepID=UPI0026052BA4|nr:malto-oligosyltrehalose synthase [uncultured Mycolicibacterium sp.]
MPAPVLATYRLQLRGDCFGFAEAERILDYLAELGVSHLYLSPILTAVRGSTHGYDVTDPTTVSAELGGADGLARLAAAARARGLGLIVDIVPNHVGVAVPRQNPWWWDVLTHGRGSARARFFDIDWDADPDGRILLPVLGSDDDVDRLEVAGETLRLGDLEFPIAPGTAGGSGREVHDRQHYRLVGWRNGVCGYRRFFSITELAALRQEDPAVFDATHAEVGRWFAAGLVDGVRVDHPDGLADPVGYLTRLRRLVGPQAGIWIEKILAVDEPLDDALPVDGTTGYDAMREIGGLFVDPTGAEALTELAATGSTGTETPDAAIELKEQAVTVTLAAELARLRRTVVRTAGADDPRLPAAVAALIARVGVYRSDYPALAGVLPAALAATEAARPDLAEPLTLLAGALAADAEAAARFQQLCGAATAKAMEDCLFYRDARLVALNEVGGEPHRFGVSAAEFHTRAAARARHWPRTLVALSTHDTKRGEDVRARIGVLSQVPDVWARAVTGWLRRTPAPDPATAKFLLQNMFGVWPTDGAVTAPLRDRLHAYAEKAIREAGLHTGWADPDERFEAAVHRWVDAVVDGPVGAELTGLAVGLEPHARNDAVAQKLLSLTVPGIPDLYQGTELFDDSLVDPDNRRPVDFAARRAALAAGEHPKLRVVTAALRLRRDRPEVFGAGDYRPRLARGTAAAHLVAFTRADAVLVAVRRWTVRLDRTGWGDTVLPLPSGTWTDRLGGAVHRGTVAAADLFGPTGVALLERADG